MGSELNRFYCEARIAFMRISTRLAQWFVQVSMTSVAATFGFAAAAQNSAAPPAAMTADQDHQNRMDQLGIKALRPGPSGDEKAANHANYDESKANPFPDAPDPLTMNDGKKVTTAQMWWDKRRPEIVEMFEKYVYGRVPRDVPNVKWTVMTVDHERIGF